MSQKLQQQLKELGSKLENLPASKDALIKLLKHAATCLSELDQSASPSMVEAMKPCLNAIGKPELLKHQDKDVKLLVATCICEITRITAPEAPYNDDVLKDIFQLIVGTFSGLGDINSPSFGRRVIILDTLARYRSCVVMLDLECDDLVTDMFHTFLAVVSDAHPENVFTSMQTIMVLLLEESEEIQENLLFTLFSVLGREKSDVSTAAWRLVTNVIEHCAVKLEPPIKQFLISSMSGDHSSLNTQLDYHDVIYDLYQCAPQILSGIIPYITGELLTDKLDVRLKAVKLLGDVFSLPGHAISETFRPLFSEFLKRMTDRVAEVRLCVIVHVKNCLMTDPFRAEAPDIITALCDRLLDYDENVRREVVATIYDVACRTLKSIPAETAKVVAERLRDKSVLVKRYTMERLAELYQLYCLEYSKNSVSADEFEWIPGKILRCLYDKDFRSETIEVVLCGSLPPNEFSIRARVKFWVAVFAGFEKVEVKALEKLLSQKQRLQHEMQRYLSLRQTYQDGDAPELQKKILGCFRMMSRWFTDPAKAEESFLMLNQLKDANIWKILTCLLDPSTSFQQAYTYRDDLLKILGEKHPLHDFLDMLSLKCSYLLFNKELAKEILFEVSAQKSSGNAKLIQSGLNLLVFQAEHEPAKGAWKLFLEYIICGSVKRQTLVDIICSVCRELLTYYLKPTHILASSYPLFLVGSEEDLVNLLKEDNEIIKEGILQILAKAGGTIREQLATTSSSVDLLLETLCLEGSRKLAKYSVQALAAITKDDGLKSLSVLYKRLVDMLEKETHLPAVLQSLGCIAQTAMPVFETRESEIVDFITGKILKCSNKTDESKTCWHERSELCLLKVFGIKALVKSYLPLKDAHLRGGIENLLGNLKNILSFGEVSNDIKSSDVDKAHLRLASAKSVLRLSKYWDHKIPIDVFHLTLRTSQDTYPEARRLFLSKLHQYIKERLLDPKYACAFLFNMIGSDLTEFKEDKHNLIDVVQICYQLKTRQLSMQNDMNSNMAVAYPENILPYLVHALAHHSSFPNIDECRDVEAFEPIYRQLHLFLCVLMHGYEDGQSQVSTNKEVGSVSAVVSIFQGIKCSEDVLDGRKSKNSHAICDLGLAITKHLVNKQEAFPGLTMSVTLPPALYRPLDRKKDENSEVSEEQSWLAGDTALAHFESLKFEDKEEVHPDVAEDENGLKDSDQDGAEVPLRKIMKSLKSHGTKKKKVVKKRNFATERSKPENDFDVMGMVREINLDNLERSMNIESSKGTDYHEHFASGKPADKNIDKKVPKSRNRKKKETSNTKVMPLSKQKGSTISRSTGKGRKKASQASLYDSNISSLQSFDMDLGVNVVGEAIHGKKESPELVDTGRKSSVSNIKSSSGSMKKRKRRSVAGLAKCSSKTTERQDMELIGCRVKVWWPIDKQFYEGVVQSYDLGKKKHVILYDDGDMEVLQLDKERWEMISNGYKPRKRSKRSNVSPSKGISAEKRKRKLAVGVSKCSNNSPKKFRRKATPKKSVERDGSGISESNMDADTSEAGNEIKSGMSNGHRHTGAEVDHVSSDDSKEKQASDSAAEEQIEEEPTNESDKEEREEDAGDSKESDKEEREEDGGDSKESDKEEIEEGPADPRESDKEGMEDEPADAKESDTEGMEEGPTDPKESDKEEMEEDSAHSRESEEEEMEEDSKDQDEAEKEEKLDSSDAKDSDSDDEPLSMWKRRAAKKSQR